ncbi:variable surface protein [Plasmodium gonderi]|uniref:Variable surface protein n=1 Tax=Plasmodium gonderi TaxID=77519 RepID=A0A1Y1JWL1_PLAGO|nr:variable surface protein [Plasmodium gonderi]GAW84713.1 variable surface protein [Plasmodium gonderi]
MEKYIISLNFFFVLFSSFLYDTVKKFPLCKKKIEEKEIKDPRLGGTWRNECKKSGYNSYLKELYTDDIILENKCIQAMEYLSEINNDRNQFLTDAGCEYFYYWIYDVLIKRDEEKINYIQMLYDIFFSIYENSPFRIYKLCDLFEHTFKSDDFNKVIEVYDIYNSIYENTKPEKKDDAFKEAVKIVERYNKKLESKSSEITGILKEEFCKNNSGVTIIITFFVTIMVFLSLIILYKVNYFTIFGSWWRNIIKRKIIRCNNTDKEWNAYQGSEIYSTISRDIGNNILYISP